MANEEIKGKFEMLEAPELNQDMVRMTETILSQHAEILKMNSRLLAVLSAPLQFVAWREEG